MVASTTTHKPSTLLVIHHPRVGGIDIGGCDLCYRDGSGNVYRASTQADAGTPAANYAAFAAAFVGIAAGGAHAEDARAGEISIYSDGEVEMDCDATTWAVGDLVSAVEDASGTALENQKVARTTTAGEAIGRCIEAGTNLTRCKFVLQPKYLLPA